MEANVLGMRVVAVHCPYNVRRKEGVRTLDMEKGVLKEDPWGKYTLKRSQGPCFVFQMETWGSLSGFSPWKLCLNALCSHLKEVKKKQR